MQHINDIERHVWADEIVESPPPNTWIVNHANALRTKIESHQKHHNRELNIALQLAEAFYTMFKSACLGISDTYDLERLYYATFHAFAKMDFEPYSKNCPSFKKVLVEMERGMRVVRNPTISLLEWTEKPFFDHTLVKNQYDSSCDFRIYRISHYEEQQMYKSCRVYTYDQNQRRSASRREFEDY